MRLAAVSELIGGHGVEYLDLPSGPPLAYVNMGDPYRTTIFFLRGKYRIGSWGDELELDEAAVD